MRGSRGTGPVATSLAVVAVAIALGGCGDGPPQRREGRTPAPPAASPTAMLPADGPVRAVGTVLDDGAGPELCLGGVAMSLPPQCDGPPVAGCDWDARPDHESAGGVRWGEYTMTGDWDGTTFTPDEVRATEDGDLPAEDLMALFAAPCPEPEGGWRPVDPATTSLATLREGQRVAEGLPDRVLTWVDRSPNPAWRAYVQGGSDTSVRFEDADLSVLVVTVTDDPAAAEAAVREVWGGALCVARVAHSEARLREVQRDLLDLPGFLTGSAGSVSNSLELTVVMDDGSIQAWADEEYGEGVVTVTSALTPIR